MMTTCRSMTEQPRETDADAVNQQDIGIREKASLLLSTKVLQSVIISQIGSFLL